MTTSVTTPVLTAGTWTADAVHSDVSFKVRHMAVGKAKGTFALKSATLVVDENGCDAPSPPRSTPPASTPSRSSATRTSAPPTSWTSRTTRC